MTPVALPKKLPKQIEMAGGYIVQVVVLPRAVLNQGIGTPSDGGYWDKDLMTIFIEKELVPAEAWYVLLHEQVHVALDCLDHYTDICRCKVRSRPTHKVAHLVPVDGVGVTTGLTVEGPVVHPEGPKGTDNQ